MFTFGYLVTRQFFLALFSKCLGNSIVWYCNNGMTAVGTQVFFCANDPSRAILLQSVMYTQ